MSESNRASVSEVVTLTSLMRELKAIEEHVQKIDDLYTEQAKLSQSVAKVGDRLDNVYDEIGKMKTKITDLEGVQSEYGQMLNNCTNQYGHKMSGHGSKKGGLCQFLYDSETKTVMGRTGKQWFQLTAFYIIFYAALVGFWIACMAGFLTTTNTKEPTLKGFQNMLQLNPAIGYRPQIDFETNLIKFNASDPTTFTSSSPPGHLEDIRSFMKPYYDPSVQAKLRDCPPGQRADSSAGCKFRPLVDLNATTCLPDFGFANGTPCILLKMNRIYGWMPNRYANGTYQNVKLRCEGENEADKETIGELEYFPGGEDDNGTFGLIDSKYFPFLSQPNYLSPFVLVRFKEIKRFTVALVWCTFDDEAMNFSPGVFWSSRILTERAGGIHFEILVDDVPPPQNRN